MNYKGYTFHSIIDEDNTIIYAQKNGVKIIYPSNNASITPDVINFLKREIDREERINISNSQSGSYCREHNCPWLDNENQVCNSPNDQFNGECDYDWAIKCPNCGKLTAISDFDGYCAYCDYEIELE